MKYLNDFRSLEGKKEWKTYQEYLQDRLKGYISQFMTDTNCNLKALQERAIECKKIIDSVPDYISEQEDALKENNK